MSEVVSIPVQAVAPIPGSIVKAIVTVQAAIAAVTRDGKNQHGGYAYASTDAIYAMLTHKLAEAGLAIMCLEEHAPEIVKVEKEGKTQQWGKFAFSFVLATEQATWTDARSRRSLFTAITGPQTFMAAQSYAEKTYLKSLFKIPTGDKFELDGLPQDDVEDRPKRKSSAEGKRDGSVKKFNQLRADITAAQGAIECREVWVRSADFLSTAPRAWYETLLEDYSVAMSGFGVDVDLPEQSELMPQAAE